ncbi:MAG TPA: lysylphosphatidylglycerol synthase transmembrane domain-containing protein [Bryobacteraceae bacterium]|nr:lysylphosphatidylglycerol synthase transmembrane domain-containing protein [Bryobacteraceae bacterium]
MWAARRKIPRWVPQCLSYALSAGCLIWVLHSYKIGDLLPELRQLEWKWVALGVALDLSVYISHAWRWILLYRPVDRLPFWRTVQAIYIGLFANEVLPLRVGELIRGYLVAHWNDQLTSVVFASIGIERLIDGFWMVLSFIVAVQHLKGIPGWLTDTVRFFEVLVAAGSLLLAYVMIHKSHAHALVRESRWAATLRHVVEGLHTMGNWRTLARVMPVSFLYLILQVFSYWALMKSFQLDLSAWDATAVLAIVRLGTAVPNAPGNIGLINAACLIALYDVFGVERNDATTFSFVLFLALTLPLLVGGAIATALTGLNLGEIHHHARRHMQASETRPPEDLV